MKNKINGKDEMLLNLGIAIRKLRLKKGYKSAEMFSYENNLNRTAYWRWENGQNITMKNFFKICNIHSLTPKEFFDLIENKFMDQKYISYLNEPQDNFTASRSTNDEV